MESPRSFRKASLEWMKADGMGSAVDDPALLKALIRQDANVSRCQLRGGVHLDQGYVNDVCLTPRFNQCVFYEDELTKE